MIKLRRVMCRCKQFWHEDRNCHVKQEWFTCALFYVFNFSCLAYLFRIMIKINKRARKKTNSQSTINFNSGENRLRFPYDLPRSLPPSFSFSTSKKEEEVDGCEKFYTTFISEEFNKIGWKNSRFRSLAKQNYRNPSMSAGHGGTLNTKRR